MNETESGFFLIDKPIEWTSFGVVNKVRYIFKYLRKTKVKIGHAGTLDPLATGLLILCYGKMTKEIHRFQDLPKEYTGEIKLGSSRPSFDLETEIDQVFPINHITDDLIKNAAKNLTGKIKQRAPDFSAKKVGGRRAYSLARQGLETGIRENEVEVSVFETEFLPPDIIRFRVECGKGTYIRSLADDIGKQLGSGAHLLSLRRTAIGPYRIEDAVQISDLESRFEDYFKTV